MQNFNQHAKVYLFAEFKNNSQQRFLPCALIAKLFFLVRLFQIRNNCIEYQAFCDKHELVNSLLVFFL